ncbi:hypothetical protein O181_046529 [Austropuccinia psidii MF-1]|uniref:Mitochondrial carrier protein n=1 Tax=Austropuccinia psidii MF-1 TaxID=1389203 RepID=A0A9Q3HLB1_9BASI|nr:hypothetical protein [Austropuccinia psidii MF-1]
MGKDDLSPFGNALAGAIGGVISNAVVYPLDTVKTKVQAESEKLEESLPSPQIKRLNAPSRLPFRQQSAFQVFLRIYKLQGIGGFYRGFLASMLNTFSMQFAYFYWYMVVRKTYISKLLPKSSAQAASKAVNLGIATELTLGALAGAIAQIFTIPVSVVATRQQLENSKTGGKSLLATASEIIRDDGPTGLWRGLKPSLVLTINPAITYGSFEQLKFIFLGPEGKMTPGKAFWIGALSKTLATVVTYPYIMAKVRLQAKYEVEGSSGESHLDAGYKAADQKQPRKERYSGAIDVLKQVHTEKGYLGWYQGMQAQIMKAVLSQALLFGIKDALEDYTVLILIIFSSFAKSRQHKLKK